MMKRLICVGLILGAAATAAMFLRNVMAARHDGEW